MRLLSIDVLMLFKFSLVYFALFAVAEFFYHVVKIKVEYTRKLVHICTGLIALTFPLYLTNMLEIVVLCGSFLLLLSISYYYRLLSSIDSIERKSYGSLMFPITVIGLFMMYRFKEDYLYYCLPLLILTLSDPVAAIVGKRYNLWAYDVRGHRKTYIGSIGFFMTSLLISFFSFSFLIENLAITSMLCYAFIIAGITTVIEGLSINGLDNITIPAGAAIILHCLGI